MNEFPRVAAAFLWAASRDGAMIVEHLVSVGRRNAIERTGHFLTELAERLNLGGLAKAQMLNTQRFNCPLTQFELADALGLTAIHLLTLHNRIVMIHDLSSLRKLAGFQGGYLNGVIRPSLSADAVSPTQP